MSTDIKVGDLLECVRSDDSELITEGKTYPVVLSEGGILSLRTDIDGMLLVYLENYLEPKASGSLKFKKVETMKQFKVGDLVFEVSFKCGVKLKDLTAYNNDFYPLQGFYDLYTTNGFSFKDEKGLPSLLHATPENREKLVAIWGEDAVPTLPLRGSELTKKLLESQRYVVAWVSNVSDDDARECCNTQLLFNSLVSGMFEDVMGCEYSYAVPIDPKTGEEITGDDDE